MDVKNLILAVTMTVILPINVYGQQADCDSLSVKTEVSETMSLNGGKQSFPHL